MKMQNVVVLALLGALASQPAVFAAQDAPMVSGPMAGGQGPGMGHDYRRNVGGPGTNLPAPAAEQAAPADSDAVAENTRPQVPDAQSRIPAAPPAPQVLPMPYGGGYPAYPGRARGTVMMPPRPDWTGYPVPAYRQGYGYPGFRGQGYAPYPRHRQYANPPGIPSAPTDAD